MVAIRILAWAVFLATVSTGAAGCASKPRVMIVGDSISAGPGCYKKYLVQDLKQNEVVNYEFVGEYADACGGGVQHSAVSCTTTANYTQSSFVVPQCFPKETFPGMTPLMRKHRPDVVMIQLGVNDVWDGSAEVATILANYQALVEQARAQNPNIVLIVAQIQKIMTNGCTNRASAAKAEELVKAVPSWAARVSTPSSPVLVADLWTNSDPRDGDDCVHPNDAGARRMARNWSQALKRVLK